MLPTRNQCGKIWQPASIWTVPILPCSRRCLSAASSTSKFSASPGLPKMSSTGFLPSKASICRVATICQIKIWKKLLSKKYQRWPRLTSASAKRSPTVPSVESRHSVKTWRVLTWLAAPGSPIQGSWWLLGVWNSWSIWTWGPAGKSLTRALAASAASKTTTRQPPQVYRASVCKIVRNSLMSH